jgi:hypothetical protein
MSTLSPMQQGMLFHTLYDQQAGNYINQMRVEVQGLDATLSASLAGHAGRP